MTDLNQKKERDQWGSKLGFIFAAAGSAVGLGNLWKFPYLAGQNGGGVFVVIYLGLVLLIGFTLMMAELVLGRNTQLSPVGAFRKIKQKWAWVGGIGVLASFLIVTYYSVIGGWIIKYIVSALTGAFNTTDLGTLESVFVNFIGAPVEPLIYHGIFMLITLGIVMGGISGGIEKASKILMPGLFIMMVVLMVRSITLPGAMAGVEYLLKPDFSKLNMGVVVSALGQVFFSLSLGMGVMVTYGSYLPKDENLVESSLIIPALDTIIALLAGLTILPAVFALGFDPSGGPGLLFITLPGVFAKMPFGSFFAVLFFVLVLFAAVTSSISLLEAAVSLTVDQFKWERKKATIGLGILAFLIGVPSSLANGPVLGNMTFIAGTNFFDSMGIITDNLLLPLAALTLSIFVGWVWGTDKAVAEATNGGKVKFALAKTWSIAIKYVAPIAIGYILISGLIPLFK
ncbi:sodium-dependent transporter [Alkaliphilus oremlandii]|uniref:Transporter n=1 Tax=Alkaliphilus oremlandii (strain OhILAs) TaxID=350688 RepID=A8MJZ9_ALKOO|nr:sodium-dependent transporter [Alkaliphilus oremlandii]ABW20131.1 sodium:neurotransmitter symporter [Alkaliphilus oremlandii OhILAs]